MNSLFWTSYAALWVLVAILVVMVLLLYRQFGLMLIPGRQRADLAGLDIGATAPPLELDFPMGDGPPVLAWRSADLHQAQLGWLALFANPQCPICERLWEAKPLRKLADAWPNVEFIWIDAHPRLDAPPTGWSLAVSENQAASKVMEVPVFPFAYAIKPGGIIAGKRLVNEPEYLDLLLEDAFVGDGKTTSLSTSDAEASMNAARKSDTIGVATHER
jgi:hypothetical protein